MVLVLTQQVNRKNLSFSTTTIYQKIESGEVNSSIQPVVLPSTVNTNFMDIGSHLESLN
jgi:hypothetical protein